MLANLYLPALGASMFALGFAWYLHIAQSAIGVPVRRRRQSVGAPAYTHKRPQPVVTHA